MIIRVAHSESKGVYLERLHLIIFGGQKVWQSFKVTCVTHFLDMKSMTHSHLYSLKMNSHTFQNVIHFTLGCPQASTDQKPLCLHVGIYEWKHSVIGEFSESNSQTVRIKPYSPTPGQALFYIYVHILYLSPLFIH